MSRKSRYDIEEAVTRPIIKWKAGAYIRLSKEDEDKSDKDSQSVISQQRIIDKFVSLHSDIEIFDYYIDDGYSGTTMQRPSFQRMKTDFEQGTINCIIVKDLSRFARNDDESGKYIYVIFPFYKIRFISVNDRVDSYENPRSVEGLEISFKNIMHSEYSRDISKKVRSASEIRRKRGEFIGAFCAYGYRKDPDDCHRLIVDEEAAAVVRFIFHRYLEIQNFLQIAKELSAKNTLTPYGYKLANGLNFKLAQKQIDNTIWKSTTIKHILEDEVYLGHLVQGKYQTVSYKNSRKIKKDQSEWIRVLNTHEPIIDEETFAKVSQLIAQNTKPHSPKRYENILAGKVFCGECRATLSRAISETTEFKYYYCKTAYLKKDACTPKRIRNDKLETAILDSLNLQLKLCLNMSQLLVKINNRIRRISSEKNVADEKYRNKLASLGNSKSDLYVRYKSESLTKEQYLCEKEKIEKEILSLENSIAHSNSAAIEKSDIREYPIFAELITHKRFNRLTIELMDRFVEKITVYSPTEIEIRFTFADELIKIQDYIEKYADKHIENSVS